MECERSGVFWKKTTFITLGVVVFLTVMYLGSAYSHQNKDAIGSWYISNELNLNEEQQIKFEQLQNKFATAKSRHETDRMVLHRGLIEFVESNKVTEENLNKLLELGKKSFDRTTLPVLEEIVAFNDSLNDEQRKQVAEHLRRHFKGSEGGHQSRHGERHHWM